MKRIGFIGYGLRSETMMKSFRSLEADITVTAVADPRHAEIAPGLAGDPYFAYTRWYADADELLAGEALDGGVHRHTLLAAHPLRLPGAGYGIAPVFGKARVHHTPPV